MLGVVLLVIPLASDILLNVLASPNLEVCLLAFVLPNEKAFLLFFYQNHHFDLRVVFFTCKPNPKDGFLASFLQHQKSFAY